jgi:hypothetical protein
LGAFRLDGEALDEFQILQRLSALSDTKIPAPIASLAEKEPCLRIPSAGRNGKVCGSKPWALTHKNRNKMFRFFLNWFFSVENKLDGPFVSTADCFSVKVAHLVSSWQHALEGPP